MDKRFLGGCACSFGAGVLFTAFLPCGILLGVQGIVLLGVGALFFCC